MPRLTLRDATKRYGTVTRTEALRGADLDIPQSSYLAIQGESGGGKSTLLNILGLLDTPSSGSYRIDGQDVAALTEREACVHRSDTFAFIFQSFHLMDRRAVVENVELPLHYRGIDSATRRRRALEALDEVGIGELAHSRPRQLSGGQRQRVAIARAVASGTPIVVADEPTGNLDSGSTETIMSSFARLARRGTTIILVTHSEQVAVHANRRVTVVDGTVEERVTVPVSNELPDPPNLPEPPKPPGRPSTVRLRSTISDAAANLMSRPGRTAGLIAAIAVAAALFVSTLGLAATAQQQVSEQFDAAKSRDVTATISGDGVSPTITRPANEAASAIATLNGTDTVAVLEDLGTTGIRVGAPRAPVDTSAYAGYGNIREALRLTVDWADGLQESLSSDEVLLGQYLAEGVGLAPIDLSPTVEISGNTYTVVGVIEDSPRAPDLLGKLVTGGDSSSALPVNTLVAYVVTKAGAANNVATEVPLVLDPLRPEGVDVQAPLPPDSLRATVESSVAMSMTLLTIVTGFAAAASVIIAALAAVAERRNEIGLRRAIGARKRHISAMLLTESSLIGLFGSLVGIVAGMAAVLAVTIANRWTPVFDSSLILLALGAGIAISAIGAVAGAVRANRIVPADALRS